MQVQFQHSRSSRNGLLTILIWLYFLAGPFTLTQDIPVHIYTGRIMKELLFSGSSVYSNWFEWGENIWVNSFTQWAALLLSYFCSPEWVHRLLVLFMVTTTFSGSRAFLNSFYPEKEENAPLILPFIVSVLFLKGFSNFIFGIGLMLYLLSTIPKLSKKKNSNLFILLSILIYLTNPLVFYLAIALAIFLILSYSGETTESKTEIIPFNNRIKLLWHLIPVAVVYIIFSPPTHSLDWNAADAGALWEKIRIMQDWIWYSESEGNVFKLLLLSLSFLTILNLYYTRKLISLLFSILGISLLLVYFYAPSGQFENLYIHSRVLILMSISLSIGIAFSDIPSALLRMIRYFFLAAFIFLLWNKYDTQKQIEKEWKNIRAIGSEIPTGSVVMPLIHAHQEEFSQNARIFLHVLPLVSDSKNIIFLDNYSAHTDYFPIKWKEGKDPYVLLGNSWEAHPPKPDSTGVSALGVTHAFILGSRELPLEGIVRAQNTTASLIEIK
jgi:heme/copper-type cytochrome/quinol oxidase subunit 2